MLHVIPQVVSQHAEEAAFLWLLREDAVEREPHYNLKDIAELDARVEAHVQGLRVNGDPAWEVLVGQLEDADQGEVFAAAVLALESGDASRIDQVLEVAGSSLELQRGFVSALGWTASEHVKPMLAKLVVSEQPARRRIGIAGYAIRRSDPGNALANLLSDSDPTVAARSCRAVAELGRVDVLRQLDQLARAEDGELRFWSVWSLVRLGVRAPAVLRTLRDMAELAGPFQEQAVGLLARVAPLGDVKQWLTSFAQSAETQRVAAIGIAALGDPELISVLFQLMQVDEVARVAGEAFSMISGIDLAYDDLEQDEPEGFEAGPTEDPADEDVAMDPDENLPWPQPQLIAARWQAIQNGFSAGRRYLCGREIAADSLPLSLYEGFQRQRASAALELGLLDPKRPLFEVRVRGDWQQKLLPTWYPIS